MSPEDLKRSVAEAALDYVDEQSIVGIGTGSTVNYFIEALAGIRDRIKGCVASSVATEIRLKALKIPVVELNSVDAVDVYFDGADAFTPFRHLIKGGGGALTREKIIATASERFICLVDESKRRKTFSDCPVPLEVIPMARSFVARETVKLGGRPVYRQNFTTDNGNIILDIHNWAIAEPLKLEYALNNIPGVVCSGIFADRVPDLILISSKTGMTVLGSAGV